MVWVRQGLQVLSIPASTDGSSVNAMTWVYYDVTVGKGYVTV